MQDTMRQPEDQSRVTKTGEMALEAKDLPAVGPHGLKQAVSV
jgi:hypothetical protein